MRDLEATQIYRARLSGGTAPITLAADLKRGAYAMAAMSPGQRSYAPYPRSAGGSGPAMALTPDSVGGGEFRMTMTYQEAVDAIVSPRSGSHARDRMP